MTCRAFGARVGKGHAISIVCTLRIFRIEICLKIGGWELGRQWIQSVKTTIIICLVDGGIQLAIPMDATMILPSCPQRAWKERMVG